MKLTQDALHFMSECALTNDVQIGLRIKLMYELNRNETQQVNGGMDNLSANATISTLSGTVIGGSVGTVIALNIAVPTASLLPVWIAACTGAGGAIGTLLGIAFAMGTFSGNCSNCSTRK